jgi:hypothetical protein
MVALCVNVGVVGVSWDAISANSDGTGWIDSWVRHWLDRRLLLANPSVQRLTQRKSELPPSYMLRSCSGVRPLVRAVRPFTDAHAPHRLTEALRLVRGHHGSKTSADVTPIGELVDGLHEVAALPIAYTRLPRRAHTAFAEDFTCWSEQID